MQSTSKVYRISGTALSVIKRSVVQPPRNTTSLQRSPNLVNGRTARLLTTLILHLGGYDLKGLYSLEEYYAKNLLAYYRAISIGSSHNYYFGRAETDITSWIEYFIEGMAFAF